MNKQMRRSAERQFCTLEHIPQMRYNADMLKNYLKENGISVYRLAKESRVPYSTLNDLVNHKITIDSFKLGPAKLTADALRITLDEFYELCREDSETVCVGNVVGTIGIKGRRYYVNYELDGEKHHDDLCMVRQENDCFVKDYAKWKVEDAIVETELERRLH